MSKNNIFFAASPSGNTFHCMVQNLILCSTVFLLLVFGIAAYGSDSLVWQLGKPDGSYKEFKPYYNAWEYGTAPAIQKSPAMNHQTFTFKHEVKENKAIPNPQVVSGLASSNARNFMKPDEIVTNLKLLWSEEEAGNRKLIVMVTNWSNPMKDKDGIEIDLPDGGKKKFDLPGTKGWGKNEKIKDFSVIFPVKTGQNSAIIKIVSSAKHHRFQFDNIALYKTDSAVEKLPPILKSSFDSADGIYHPDDEVKLNLEGWNLPGGRGQVIYKVEDFSGKQVASGKTDLIQGRGAIRLSTFGRGWFKISYSSCKLKFAKNYVVIEPVKAEYISDSRFGCHAINTDGYRLREWVEKQNIQMRRAFLGGAKWIRHHSIHWFLREPQKGKFDWTYLDKRLASAEKYKMNVLMVFGGTPAWASTSQDKRLNTCGAHRYQFSPPKNWQDWTDFVETVVDRYKDRIKWYELWNEPGFTSAFWSNGSAKDYAMLLKTGYIAAKKADPDCKIVSGAPLTSEFISQVIKDNDGKRYFDIMSVHYLQLYKPDSTTALKWKAFMDRLGGGIPLINTEEMNWTHGKGKDDLAKAATLVKLYTREAALGVSKTFAFDLFRSGSSYNASAFDWQGNVLPLYAAYRTMTHRLEHAKYVADLSVPGAEAYLFDRDRTPVIVFWSGKEQYLNLVLGGDEAKLINMMDNESVMKTEKGKFKVQASAVPQFIEGGNMAFLSAYAKLLKQFPRSLIVRPGRTVVRTINPGKGVRGTDLLLPKGWTGTFHGSTFRISVPQNAPNGIYDIAVALSINGTRCTVPVVVDVSSGIIGENLITNGDFAKGTAYWFYPKNKKLFDLVKGGGINGSNAIQVNGVVHFGFGGKIKVRQGERYALVVEAKGTGGFGGIYSVYDKNSKKIFPKKQGVNCLMSKVGPEWKIFSQEILISQPEASSLKIGALANYRDKSGQVLFNRIAIVRLTGNFNLSKVIWQGSCVQSSGMPSNWNNIPSMTVNSSDNVNNSSNTKWSGPADLSASCQLAMDRKNLYLRFEVKDDKHKTASGDISRGWMYDSIQFAVDPTLEGRDWTEILIAQDSQGKAFAYKYNNYWTPELPDNITKRGLMPDVKISITKNNGNVLYNVTVPLNELYPLSAKTKKFGFSWLVNDNDGEGRKYIQWSSGVGGNKKPNLFGMIKCISGN